MHIWDLSLQMIWFDSVVALNTKPDLHLHTATVMRYRSELVTRAVQIPCISNYTCSMQLNSPSKLLNAGI